MIDRRSQGLFHLHTIFAAVVAVGLWLIMSSAPAWTRFYVYYSLLPGWAYCLSVTAGLVAAMRYWVKADVGLVTLGWVGSIRMSTRQTLGVACAVFALAVAAKDVGLSRVFIATYLLTLWGTLTFVDRYQPAALVNLFLAKSGRVPMLVMGRRENFPGLEAWLEGQRLLGFEAVGILAYGDQSDEEGGGLPLVGTFERIEEAIVSTGAKQVLMLELPRSVADVTRLTRACTTSGCRLMIHNNLVVHLESPLRALTHHGFSFLVLHDEPLESLLNRGVKRIMDVLISLPVVIFVLPPLVAVVGVMQFAQSRGRVFYTQTRSGRSGQPFRIWKFRTMHEAAGANLQQAQKNDDRIYPFGRFLRRSSLDEMPQFWNVLIGEMSVVGPRPHVLAHDALFEKSAEIYRMRQFVKPGITGLAQSRGFRGEATSPEQIQERVYLDLIYIRSWSAWLDVVIVLRTFGQMFMPPRTAY